MKSRLARSVTVTGVGAVALALLNARLFPPRPEDQPGATAVAAVEDAVPQGAGLATKYPGDAGIERDPAVVFAEDFEAGTVEEIGKRWGDLSNKGGKVVALSDDAAPAGSGKRSLQMTATRGENEGGHLFKVLEPGHDQLYCRFYVKFAPDHGFIHHFVKLQGALNPPRYPVGGAGSRPTDSWTTGIEPADASRHKYPGTPFPPPGIWHFYTYWPEMRSWENPDGTGTSFYGNNFEPKDPVVVPRDKWICVEFMVEMNSDPDKTDGEQAFWIDGKLAERFAPGSVVGYWMRDCYRLDDEKGKPFEGFRWRKDMRLNVNKLWLLHYVTENAFKMNDDYAAKHAEVRINTKTATVWFDDIVVARGYIGPVSRG
jgi:hypothetical protein